MEITYKDNNLKIKCKSGTLCSGNNKIIIESADGLDKKEITAPGEYEISGITVLGLAQTSIFIYEIDNIRVCNLSQVTEKIDNDKLSQIGSIDILIFSVFEKSLELVQQIESHYLIPIAWQNQIYLDNFIKESGFLTENMSKFTIKKEEIIEDSPTSIVVLS